MNKPISEFNEELEAFRRLPARERIEQLTLKLETDEAVIAEFNDAFCAWEKQHDNEVNKHV